MPKLHTALGIKEDFFLNGKLCKFIAVTDKSCERVSLARKAKSFIQASYCIYLNPDVCHFFSDLLCFGLVFGLKITSCCIQSAIAGLSII